MTQQVYKKHFPSWSTYSTQENAVIQRSYFFISKNLPQKGFCIELGQPL